MNHSKTQDQNQPLRILSIGAHPADVFDQSGGTMAHHAARGDWVGCVVLSHGARVHDKVICDEMFEERQVPEAGELARLLIERGDVKAEEVKRACAILGVEHVHFLGMDDAVLLVTEPAVRNVARLIRKLRPDVVITHYPKENGGYGPHAAAGEIVMRAIELAAAPDPPDRSAPHNVAQIFFYGAGAAAVRSGIWSSEGGFYNDVFIDIEDVIEEKLAAIDMLESQGYSGAYARKRIETSDGAFGSGVAIAYAEGFISCRSTIHDYLPLPDKTRRLAKLSNHTVLRESSFSVASP